MALIVSEVWSMDCPTCKYQDTRVIESRPNNQGDHVRRRRECMRCGHRMTTEETIKPVENKRKSYVIIK
jgi:transcriptional regulator NrdR family protein